MTEGGTDGCSARKSEESNCEVDGIVSSVVCYLDRFRRASFQVRHTA